MVVTGGLSFGLDTPFLTARHGEVDERPQFLRTTGQPLRASRTSICGREISELALEVCGAGHTLVWTPPGELVEAVGRWRRECPTE
jgi:hypothetical protein